MSQKHLSFDLSKPYIISLKTIPQHEHRTTAARTHAVKSPSPYATSLDFTHTLKLLSHFKTDFLTDTHHKACFPSQPDMSQCIHLLNTPKDVDTFGVGQNIIPEELQLYSKQTWTSPVFLFSTLQCLSPLGTLEPDQPSQVCPSSPQITIRNCRHSHIFHSLKPHTQLPNSKPETPEVYLFLVQITCIMSFKRKILKKQKAKHQGGTDFTHFLEEC